MEKASRIVFLFLVFFTFLGSLFFTACETASPGKEFVSDQPVSDQIDGEEEKKPEKTDPKEPLEETEKTEEEEVPKEAEDTEETEDTEEDFVVTDEVFAQTFSDVEALITELNKTIRNQNYEKWLTFLTEEYKDYYSGPEVLRELSNKPTMQKYDIRLTTLKDYFTYVVVPSRSNARLDDLVFEDNNHVKAIMIIDERRVILYQLVKIDGEWKIGV